MQANSSPENGPGRRMRLDVTVPAGARDGVDILRRSWDSQVGSAIPLPPATPVGADDYRVRIRHAKVDDAVIEMLYSEGLVGDTGGEFGHYSDRVILHMVRRGEWRFTDAQRDSTVSAPAGRFVLRNNSPAWRFEVEPHTTAKILILPGAPLRPHLGDRPLTGPVGLAEMRLLTAHIRLTEAMLDDLTPSGVQAARAALVELVKGVIAHGVDGQEPLFAAAVVCAARDFVGNHLADPDLSPAVVARELNVSVRTLQRAFAATQTSVAAYIRHRRLEAARFDLAANDRPDIADLAARWQFADSSHFSSAFKSRYGQTPSQFARSLRGRADKDAPG